MPRTADHDLRRAQIAEAVRRLIAHAGLDAATMASVAREAGMSVGLVQHYFRSKDDLLLFAYQRTMADLLERVTKHIAEGEAAQRSIAQMMPACLHELLPLDERRRGEYRVGRAFHTRSLDNPTIATVARATGANLRTQIATAVTNGKECGEVDPDTDADLAAIHLAALTNGLADHLYAEPGRARSTAARVILESTLAEIFPGECRHHAPR